MKNYLQSRSQYIHHYTTIDKLALILNSGHIRCTRLDMVDDVEETKLYGDNNFASFIFVSCWTKTEEEHIPFWSMYSNHYQGVRITLPRDFLFYKKYKTQSHRINKDGAKETYSSEDFSAIPDRKYKTIDYLIYNTSFTPFPRFFDVKYTPNPQNSFSDNISQPDENSIKILGANFGTVKSDFWAFQEEVRIALTIFPSDLSTEKGFQKIKETLNDKRVSNYHLKYFDIPIDPKLLNNIKVTMGPKSGEGEKLIVESLLKKYAKNGTIEDSKLKGLIR